MTKSNASRFVSYAISTVGLSDTDLATTTLFQRKSFYANGRYWVFFIDQNEIVYSSSPDGADWSVTTSIRSADSGYNFSIWFDGTYIHYACCDFSSIYYRRGTPNADGTITWSADEQTVSTTYNLACFPSVTVDSSGYVWIGYREAYFDGTNWFYYPYVIKSGNNDGTWGDTPSGFPFQLSTTSSDSWRVSLVPLTNGKMLVVYATIGEQVRARAWNGSSWRDEVTTTSTIAYCEYYSVVAENDNAHLVFPLYDSDDVVYTKYIYSSNSFSTETTIATNINPVLSKDPATNDLYVFWVDTTTNHVYFRKYTSSTDTWEDTVDWIDESDSTFTNDFSLTCFYQACAHGIGVVYLARDTAPYAVRFSCWSVTAGSLVGKTESNGTASPFQRKSFYANGRFWLFWDDGSNMVYSTSTNGSTWSEKTIVRTSGDAEGFSIWFDGTYVHYAYAYGSSIYYRRGTPNSDGTITWSADEQTVSTVYNQANKPFIAVDTNGYVWIGYNDNQYPYVIKSGNNDGTWGDTPQGFPYRLSTRSDPGWTVSVIPLTNGKVLALFLHQGTYVFAKAWNGSTWLDTVQTQTNIDFSDAYSAVAQGDDVHLVFLQYYTPQAWDILYTKYSYSSNSFGSETAIASESFPVLCRDPTTNDLYVFWVCTEPYHVYYRKYNASTNTWQDPVDWLDEEFEEIAGVDVITCFYQAYGSKIGVAYVSSWEAPSNVKFAYLTLGGQAIQQQVTETLALSDIFSRIWNTSKVFDEMSMLIEENYGLYCDGTDYVSIPIIFYGWDAFTIAEWIYAYYPKSNSEYSKFSMIGDWATSVQPLICHRTDGSTNYTVLYTTFQTRTGEGTGYIYDFNWYAYKNRWVHIVRVYSNQDRTFRVYINGELKFSQTIGTNEQTILDWDPDQAPHPELYKRFVLGARTDYFQKMQCIYDEVRIYNVALTPQEIKDLYQLKEVTRGLQLYLPLDRHLKDKSGQNRQVTNSGATFVNSFRIFPQVKVIPGPKLETLTTTGLHQLTATIRKFQTLQLLPTFSRLLNITRVYQETCSFVSSSSSVAKLLALETLFIIGTYKTILSLLKSQIISLVAVLSKATRKVSTQLLSISDSASSRLTKFLSEGEVLASFFSLMFDSFKTETTYLTASFKTLSSVFKSEEASLATILSIQVKKLNTQLLTLLVSSVIVQSKLILENLSLVSIMSRVLAFYRMLGEIINYSDVLSLLSAYKQIAECLLLTLSSVVSFTRTFVEEFTNVDSLLYRITITVPEALSLVMMVVEKSWIVRVELFSLLSQVKALSTRLFSEFVAFSDASLKIIVKGLSEMVVFLPRLTLKMLVLLYDLLGTMLMWKLKVIKTQREILIFSTIFSKVSSFSLAVAEVLTLAETIRSIIGVTLSLFESVSLITSTSLLSSFVRSYLESLYTSDLLSKILQTLQQETFEIAGILSKALSKPLQVMLTLLSIPIKISWQLHREILVVTDTFFKISSFSRTIQEPIVLQEIVSIVSVLLTTLLESLNFVSLSFKAVQHLTRGSLVFSEILQTWISLPALPELLILLETVAKEPKTVSEETILLVSEAITMTSFLRSLYQSLLLFESLVTTSVFFTVFSEVVSLASIAILKVQHSLAEVLAFTKQIFQRIVSSFAEGLFFMDYKATQIHLKLTELGSLVSVYLLSFLKNVKESLSSSTIFMRTWSSSKVFLETISLLPSSFRTKVFSQMFRETIFLASQINFVFLAFRVILSYASVSIRKGPYSTHVLLKQFFGALLKLKEKYFAKMKESAE